jgi:hypothetical protein
MREFNFKGSYKATIETSGCKAATLKRIHKLLGNKLMLRICKLLPFKQQEDKGLIIMESMYPKDNWALMWNNGSSWHMFCCIMVTSKPQRDFLRDGYIVLGGEFK